MDMPSPSLSSIKKMNMADLARRIDRLTDEIARVDQKVERLKKMHDSPLKKIEELGSASERLTVLRQAARDQLAMKEERKSRWDQKHDGGR